MPIFHNLSTFDLAILGIFLLSCLRGLWIGGRRQMPTVLALVGGYVLAGRMVQFLIPWTSRLITSPKVAFVLVFGLIGLVGWIILRGFVKLLSRVQQQRRIGWRDRLFGLIVGGCVAAVVTSLLYMVLASTLSTTNTLLRTSQISPFLRQGSEILRSCIVDPQLRQSFLHKEPAIVPEVRANSQDASPTDPSASKP